MPARMADRPEISVVVPCLNEEDAVGDVVDAAWAGIRETGRPGEVIVVDNASEDRSAEVAAEHGATVIREDRRGYGSAYLKGLGDRPWRVRRHGGRRRHLPGRRTGARSSNGSTQETTSSSAPGSTATSTAERCRGPIGTSATRC